MAKIYSSSDIKDAAQTLKKGGLIAFPTETVYGLGADATNDLAVKHVFEAKGRPSDNPLILHVTDLEMVDKYAILNDTAQKLMNKYWPGPLTIILKMKNNAFSKLVTGGLDTVAFRNPDHKITKELIELVGVPIVGPSANLSGKPSATRVEHVRSDFKNTIDGVLDGGNTKLGLESTVIDLTSKKPIILRPGVITRSEIEDVIGQVDVYNPVLNHPVGTPKSPGIKYKHYAPQKPVYMIKTTELNQLSDYLSKNRGNTIGLMVLDKDTKRYNLDDLNRVECYNLGDTILEAGGRLFDGLRSLDHLENVTHILVQIFENGEAGAAYRNRLDKAASGKYFNDLWEETR